MRILPLYGEPIQCCSEIRRPLCSRSYSTRIKPGDLHEKEPTWDASATTAAVTQIDVKAVMRRPTSLTCIAANTSDDHFLLFITASYTFATLIIKHCGEHNYL